MSNHALEKVINKIESSKDEMVEMAKKLISIPAIGPENGGQGEMEKAKYLEPFLKKYFDNVVECHAPDPRVPAGFRPNYIATIKGHDTSKTLWLMAHMDVVPAGDEKLWETPPFEAVVKEGKIYGRGAEDNNQSIVSTMFTVKAFKECNVTPKVNVGALLVSDEEVDSEKGVIFVLNKQKSMFKKSDLIVVPDSGDPDGVTIEVAEKTVLWLKITTKGKQMHAAFPHQGVNAHRAAANLIVMFDQLRKKYGESNPIFDPPTTTVEPTKKEANVPNINTLPGEDIIYFDCRLLPNLNCDSFLKEVRGVCDSVEKQFGVKIDIGIESKTISPATPVDAPVVKAIQMAAESLFGKTAKPIGSSGSTVCAYFRQAGLNAAGFSHLCETFHQPNEYCVIEHAVKDAKVWAHIAMA